ncbi:MAG: sulfotransferase [Gammaproteobacteria bacterium]
MRAGSPEKVGRLTEPVIGNGLEAVERSPATGGPILLMGMPRSGTTWIGKIFDSHPRTIYRHEPDNFTAIRELPLLTESEKWPQYEAVLRGAVSEILALRQTKVAASRPVFGKSYFLPGERAAHRLANFASKALARLLGEFEVPDWRNYAALRDAPLVWKSIESVGRLGTLVRALPGSRAALLVRHPCGYVASVLRGEARRQFEDGCSSSEDYGVFELLVDLPEAKERGLTIDRLHHLSPVERLAWRWVLFNEKAMNDIDAIDRARVFRYEDFCRNPESTTRAAFDFAGLSWSPQTEDFLRASTSADDARYYAIVKDPLRAAMKWQTELDAADIDGILRIAGDTRPGKLFTEEA